MDRSNLFLFFIRFVAFVVSKLIIYPSNPFFPSTRNIIFPCTTKESWKLLLLLLYSEKIVETFYGFFERVSYYYVKLHDECLFVKLTFITRERIVGGNHLPINCT